MHWNSAQFCSSFSFFTGRSYLCECGLLIFSQIQHEALALTFVWEGRDRRHFEWATKKEGQESREQSMSWMQSAEHCFLNKLIIKSRRDSLTFQWWWPDPVSISTILGQNSFSLRYSFTQSNYNLGHSQGKNQTHYVPKMRKQPPVEKNKATEGNKAPD